MVNGATNAANWFGEAVFGDGLPVKKDLTGLAPGTINGKIVHLPRLRTGTGGDNFVNYTAAFPDLIDRRNGLPVAAFDHFPLTVV